MDSPYFQVGVYQSTASRFRFPPCVDLRSGAFLSPSFAFGVGQRPRLCREDEKSLALVRSSNVRSFNERFRNSEAEIFKGGADDVEVPKADVSTDVFKEAPVRFCLSNDPLDMRPEMPWVVRSKASACAAERLTRISSNDASHFSAPRAAVEGSNVRPDRSLVQIPFAHSRRKDERCRDLPLHVTDCSSPGEGSLETKIESSNSGAEADVGMCNHTC